MLSELHIESLGLIDQLDLVLGDGLTVLTGETGAGKSMLLDAIDLLIGGRADPMVVRAGRPEARVEGRFVGDDEEFVIARVVPLTGRSRAYVDGRLATAGNLAELGSRWVDLHGQHAHQSLLATAVQRSALDRFGGVDLGPLRDARARLAEIDVALATLGGDARSRAREIDLLRFQVQELATAALDDADEDDALDREETLLAGATAHREAGLRAVEALTDDSGSIDHLRTAIAALGGRGPFDAHTERLQALALELDDAADDLRRVADAIDEDPERLQAIRERRHLLRELRRKYGDTLAEVIAYEAEVRSRLEELEGYESRAAALEGERAAALEAVTKAAAKVGRARRAAAPRLASEVAGHLGALAMPGATVSIDVGDDPGDDVEFRLAANVGVPPLPLAKVASGGELARTMLALRLVLTEAPDTLIFDEVDAGIGGSAAVAVGRSLAELGRRHQVLVVTHLAQVAALADHHLVVSKHEVGSTTTTHIREVTGGERVEEISRMLSGRADSTTARQHAEELLRSGADRGR